MFQLPAFISCALDFVAVILFFQESWLFGDTLETPIGVSDPAIDPINVDLFVVIFAGLRIIFLLPYLWHFQQDRRLNFVGLAYSWHLLNCGVITFKAVKDLASEDFALAEWLLTGASAVSVVCQTICLNHLRSTALPERHVVLGFSTHSLKISPNNKSILGTEHSLDDNESEDATSHLASPLNVSSDFLNKMRVGFDKAKEVWSEKVDRLKHLITGKDGNDEYQSVFDGVLRLFSGHGIEAVKKVETLYSMYPEEVEFYIPQMVVFLIYGSFETSGALQMAVLNMCRRSAVFAHRVYWFVVAFCLSGAGVTKEGVVALKQLLSEIEAIGEEPALKLSQGHVTTEDASDTIETSAHSEDALSKQGGDFVAIDMKGAKYPLSLCRLPQGCKSQFAPTLLFWDKMTDVSRGLCAVTRNDRTAELKVRLSFVDDFLPSATIYAPFGNEYHRVWAVHIEESFAFSTKDRVPFLVCLEVIDYELPKQKLAPKLWWQPEAISFQKTFKIGQREFTLKLGGASLPMHEQEQGSHPAGAGNDLKQQSDQVLAAEAAFSKENPSDMLSRGFRSVCFAMDTSDEGDGQAAGSITSASPKDSKQASADCIGQDSDPNVEIGQWGGKGVVPPAIADSSLSANILSTISNPMLLSSTKKKVKKVDDVEHIRLFRKDENMFPTGQRPIESIDDSGDSYSAFEKSKRPVGTQNGKVGYKDSTVDAQVSENPSQCTDIDKEWYGSTDRVGSPGPSSGGDSESYEMPPTVVFKESWKQKEARIKRTSSVGHLPGWRLLPVIVKSGDDLRQEQCASQVISQMHHILQRGGVGCWLRPYGIVAISPDSGIIEAIADTVSLDVLRRRDSRYVSLMNFFERFFGPEGSVAFTRARSNFMRSLAGYCIVCYILQLKDRHNGNILLDTSGHIIHIDFGFMLAKTPGGNIGFEKAPFKLTAEFVELLDGAHSPMFHKFRELCVRTFMQLRKNSHRIVLLLEMLSKGNEHLPCFGSNPQKVLDDLRERFRPELHDRAAMEHVQQLIDVAIDNWTTTCYDSYQRCCVGIF